VFCTVKLEKNPNGGQAQPKKRKKSRGMPNLEGHAIGLARACQEPE